MSALVTRLGVVITACCLLGVVPATASPDEPARPPTSSAEVFSGAGWNTWDIERPNAMIYMPDGVVLDLSIYNSRTGQPLGRLFLNNVQRFGPHAPDGSYSRARYEQAGLRFEIEFAARGRRLVAHVHPLTQGEYLLVAEISFAFGRHGTVQKQRSEIVVTGQKSRFFVSSPNPQASKSAVGNEHRMVWDLSADRWLTVADQPGMSPSEANCRAQVDENRERYDKARVRSGGILADGAQAAADAAAWNIVWDSRGDLPVATVAREFPAGSGVTWGGYIQGGWDAVFQALLANLQSAPMAKASILGLLSDTTANGFVPNAGTGWGVTENRSEPPIAAYAALKLYQENGDRQFLSKIFPVLYRWHQWWPSARDGNHDGLFEWGADPVSTQSFADFTKKEIAGLISAYVRLGVPPPPIKASDLADTLATAGDESGLDNSPMWDGVRFNHQTHTMEQDDVGLNSIWALDSWALAEMAHVLGRTPEEEKLRSEFKDMSARMNALMWSEEDGMYFNKSWDGTFNKRISPTNFYPLLAGIASPARARRMVQQYLLNPKKFWGEYVVPATPRDDPAFADQQYWRGRIWGPTNYLVYEGLKRNGFDEVASEFAAKSTALFLKEWQAHGHIHENYNADSGSGDDVVGSSVRYYAWGGLLPLTMVEELIDVEPWNAGLRLGSLSGQNASVSNVRIGKDIYDVFLGPGLRVIRNGQKFIDADHAVVLRKVSWGRDRVRFDVTARTAGRLILYGFRENERVECVLPVHKALTAKGGKLVLDLEPQTKAVELLRKLRHRPGSKHLT